MKEPEISRRRSPFNHENGDGNAPPSRCSSARLRSVNEISEPWALPNSRRLPRCGSRMRTGPVHLNLRSVQPRRAVRPSNIDTRQNSPPLFSGASSYVKCNLNLTFESAQVARWDKSASRVVSRHSTRDFSPPRIVPDSFWLLPPVEDRSRSLFSRRDRYDSLVSSAASSSALGWADDLSV